MSKTMRRLHRDQPSPLTHQPGQPYFPLTRREQIHMTNKHRRWPLGTRVIARGHEGRVVKHWRSTEYPNGCSIEFREPVDFGDANGERTAHVVPFRLLHRIA